MHRSFFALAVEVSGQRYVVLFTADRLSCSGEGFPPRVHSLAVKLMTFESASAMLSADASISHYRDEQNQGRREWLCKNRLTLGCKDARTGRPDCCAATRYTSWRGSREKLRSCRRATRRYMLTRMTGEDNASAPRGTPYFRLMMSYLPSWMGMLAGCAGEIQ